MQVLLCPLTDFPYMLPECTPIWQVWALAAALPLALLLYGRRRGGRSGIALQRVAGRVLGAAATGARGERLIQVQGPTGSTWVAFTPAEVAGAARLRAGQRVLVEGWPREDIRLARERLYREPLTCSGLAAVSIAHDRTAWRVAGLVLLGVWGASLGLLVLRFGWDVVF